MPGSRHCRKFLLRKEFRQYFAWRAAIKLRDEEPVGTEIKMSLKQHLRAVWRPEGIVAEGRDLALLTQASQGPRDIDSAITFLRTIGNVSAVRRPVRLPVLTRTFGDLDWVATADLLKPDVVLSASI